MSEISSQILISGASGLVGSAFRSRLQSEAKSYATLTRRHSASSSFSYFWDPYRFQFHQELRRLNGIHAAIHLAGESVVDARWTAQKKQRIRESRVRTTQAMVELLSHLETRPQVLIVASAVGFYGDRGAEILTEDSAAGVGFFPDICRAWEAAATAATALGIRVVTLRFGVILAPTGGALAKMLPLFRMGAGGKLGAGDQWMSWVSIEDVVRIIQHAIGDPTLHGPLNVVSPEPVTNAEFTRTLARHLHRRAWVTAPAFALRLALGEMADAALLSSTRALPARLLRSKFVFQHSSLSPALEALLPPG